MTAQLDWKYAAVMGAVVLGVTGAIRMRTNHVDFCRESFRRLADGKVSVEHRIDWPNLTALDVNVGQTYGRLANEREQSGYRRAFIEQFASGFQKSGTSPSDFMNWRVHERRPGEVVVAADYTAKDKTLLMAVAGKKVRSIQWQ